MHLQLQFWIETKTKYKTKYYLHLQQVSRYKKTDTQAQQIFGT